MKSINLGGLLLLSDRQSTFFDAAYQAFCQASKRTSDFFLSLNGKRIKLSFASESLLQKMTPALAHLQIENSHAPDLTLCIWDSHKSGIPMPPPPWSSNDYLPRGEILGWTEGPFSVSFQVGSSALSLFDRERSLALHWISNEEAIPYWERGAPFRTIFQWWLEMQNCTLMHAAAVGTRKKGSLIVGKGGSGKSTTALSALRSSLLYAADDYCFCTPDAIGSLYSSAKIDWRTLEKLPHLGSCKEQTEKALFFLYPAWKEKCVTSFPLHAVFIPRITHASRTTFSRCSAKEALIALAPSTIFQLSSVHPSVLQTIAQTIAKVPCFHLHLGADFAEVAETLESFHAD